jgi:hypothetical protein
MIASTPKLGDVDSAATSVNFVLLRVDMISA